MRPNVTKSWGWRKEKLYKLLIFNKFIELSCAPNRTVLEPIFRDLDRLYEMRFWIPDPTKPVTIEWLKSQGLV